MIAIVDYQIGNIRSVFKAFRHLAVDARIATDAEDIARATGVVLPGVAAFGDAMSHLEELDLTAPLRDAIAQGKHFLGICVGMQLLFEESEEMGHHQGLGVLRGRVRGFPSKLKVPQIGWNQVFATRDDPVLEGFRSGEWAYFAHSYYVEPADEDLYLTGTTYGVSYPSMVARGRLYGIQFHPEKSQRTGLRILRNFASLVEQNETGSCAAEGGGSS